MKKLNKFLLPVLIAICAVFVFGCGDLGDPQLQITITNLHPAYNNSYANVQLYNSNGDGTAISKFIQIFNGRAACNLYDYDTMKIPYTETGTYKIVLLIWENESDKDSQTYSGVIDSRNLSSAFTTIQAVNFSEVNGITQLSINITDLPNVSKDDYIICGISKGNGPLLAMSNSIKITGTTATLPLFEKDKSSVKYNHKGTYTLVIIVSLDSAHEFDYINAGAVGVKLFTAATNVSFDDLIDIPKSTSILPSMSVSELLPQLSRALAE